MPRPRAVPLAVVLLTVASLAAAQPTGEAEKLTLKKGDRIVFLGDSITQAGVGPTGYVTVLRKALEAKHPDLGVEIIGAGISGNKVPDLQRRLTKDVLGRKPTLVVVYIGINDVWHGEKDPARGTPPDKYAEGLTDVVGRLKAAGSRVLVCTPSVIGERPGGSNKNDARLDQYAELSRKAAASQGVPVCDLRRAFTQHLQSHNPENKERGILTTDGVHMNEAGNRFVAEAILKSLGAYR